VLIISTPTTLDKVDVNNFFSISILEKSCMNKIFIISYFNGVTGMAKSRQSNAVMTFMAHNDFARFARFARKRRNEKQGILEKSCHNTIFIISNFNGGHRNGKKSSEQRRNDVYGSQLLCSLFTLCLEKKKRETRHPRKKLSTHNLYTFKF
jgi:hypothetical protein